VLVSFGSYCSGCGTGCKACSSGSCSLCFYNYYLANGVCVSIAAKTTLSVYANGAVSCHSCNYPYYLSAGIRVLGGSILCQDGAIGTMYYQCLNACTVFGYSLQTFKGGLICLPYPWINGLEQIYLTAYDQPSIVLPTKPPQNLSFSIPPSSINPPAR
jgi:hypothetical protein